MAYLRLNVVDADGTWVYCSPAFSACGLTEFRDRVEVVGKDREDSFKSQSDISQMDVSLETDKEMMSDRQTSIRITDVF